MGLKILGWSSISYNFCKLISSYQTRSIYPHVGSNAISQKQSPFECPLLSFLMPTIECSCASRPESQSSHPMSIQPLPNAMRECLLLVPVLRSRSSIQPYFRIVLKNESIRWPTCKSFNAFKISLNQLSRNAFAVLCQGIV